MCKGARLLLFRCRQALNIGSRKRIDDFPCPVRDKIKLSFKGTNPQNRENPLRESSLIFVYLRVTNRKPSSSAPLR